MQIDLQKDDAVVSYAIIHFNLINIQIFNMYRYSLPGLNTLLRGTLTYLKNNPPPGFRSWPELEQTIIIIQ
jgi:hypothetical protein